MLLFIGLKYQIYWNDTEIWQKASGGKDVHIKFEEIAEVRMETAKTSEWYAMSRPFHRLAVYGEPSGGSRFLDISLRHFNLQDVHELTGIIKAKRPDLTLPKGFA